MSLSLHYFIMVSLVYVLMGWALYLPYRLRQLHFLSVALAGLGAYVGGVGLVELGLTWPLAFAMAVLVAALIGFVASLALAEAATFTVVIVGLTALILVRSLVENLEVFGGSVGLFGLPTPSRGPLLAVGVGVTILAGLGVFAFDRSRAGRAASACHTDRRLAEAQGFSVRRLGMAVQTMSCALGGAAGFLYMSTFRNLHPGFFAFSFLGTVVTMFFLGGHETPIGIILSAPILWGLSFVVPEHLEPWRMVFYAGVLILVLVVRPEGLVTRRLVLAGLRQVLSRRGTK